MSAKKHEYSRENPSPEYQRLVALYEEVHITNGTQGQKIIYPGKSLYPFIGYLKALIEKYEAKTMMDYGSGKGLQYSYVRPKVAKGKIYRSIPQYWGIVSVHCYDAGLQEFQKFPEGMFDGVLSTDVLEHCPREDLEWILGEMFSKARKFVFANIACYPAHAVLSTGENAHTTVEPPEWWDKIIKRVATNYPDIDYYFIATVRKKEPSTLISNVSEPENIPAVAAWPKSLFKACIMLLKQRLSTWKKQ